MRKNTYIGIAFIVLVFGIIFIPKIFRRLVNDDVTRGGRMHIIEGVAEENPDELDYIKIGDTDKRIPPFKFIDQHNDTITNATYRGKVYLVEFFFTKCPGICIPMNQNLIYIAEQFKDEERFGIASFSITPDYDTPEVLKAYADSYEITHPNWHFLTGNLTDVFELSNAGFLLNAEKEAGIENQFYHSGYFALIDQNGFLRSRKDNFGNTMAFYKGSVLRDAELHEEESPAQIDELVVDIKKLLNK